jgi:hypothetical protein
MRRMGRLGRTRRVCRQRGTQARPRARGPRSRHGGGCGGGCGYRFGGVGCGYRFASVHGSCSDCGCGCDPACRCRWGFDGPARPRSWPCARATATATVTANATATAYPRIGRAAREIRRAGEGSASEPAAPADSARGTLRPRTAADTWFGFSAPVWHRRRWRPIPPGGPLRWWRSRPIPPGGPLRWWRSRPVPPFCRRASLPCWRAPRRWVASDLPWQQTLWAQETGFHACGACMPRPRAY